MEALNSFARFRPSVIVFDFDLQIESTVLLSLCALIGTIAIAACRQHVRRSRSPNG